MNRDGNDLGGDGADWLLAQLAGGTQPQRDDQPEPPVDPRTASPMPPAHLPPAAPPAAQLPSAPRSPAPRREEVLDWFSEAPAPAAQADVETRALPVIGAPTPQVPVVPVAPSTSSTPATPPTAAPSARPGPSWTPPFAVEQPRPPVTPPVAPVYLTKVEPPVGVPAPAPLPPVAPTSPAAGSPPVAPLPPVAPVPPVAPASPAAAPLPPVAPATPAAPVPPGPVTPTAQFALTWNDDALESEDAIRAAFRNLAEPSPSPAPGPADAPAAPEPAAAPAAPAAPTASPWTAAASAEAEPELPADADSPFAGYAPPPVARQSFTPVPTAAPTSPTAPHPTAPAAAPAGWDERRPPAQAPVAPYDAELWAALNEAEPAAAASTPAASTPAASTPSVPTAPVAPSVPTAPIAPAAPVTPTRAEPDRFAAFAAETADPFAALTRAVPVQPPAASPAPASTQVPTPEPVSRASIEFHGADAATAAATGSAAATDSAGASGPEARGGFPFLEVRGTAEELRGAPVGAPAREASAFNTTPFPAFASGGNRGDDDPTRQPPAPVDDLLASLGGGGAGTSGNGGAVRGRDALPPAQQAASGGDATPPTGPVPSGLDALGLGFDDDADDEGATDDPPRETVSGTGTGIRGRFFGRDRVREAAPDADADADESSISREMNEAGYFWNLTPDPNAEDPKDRPEAVATSFLPAADATDVARPSNEAGTDEAWSDEAGFAEPAADEEWSNEPEARFAEADADEETDVATRMFPEVGTDPAFGQPAFGQTADPHEPSDDDSLAALFGGAGLAGGAAGSGAAGFDASGAFTPAAASAPPLPTAPNPPFGAPVAGAAPRMTSAGASGGSGAAGGPGSGGSGGSGGRGGGTPGAAKGGNRTVRTLIWVAGGLVVVLVIAGLYFLGTQLTAGGGGATQASGSVPASASETPVPAPTAPQPAGVHAWDTLFGGECVDPFVDAWAGEFTVVDCAAPHAAQLVYRGTLPGDAAAPYPGEAELAAQMPILCQAAGVFEPTLVAGIGDLQVQGAYPLEVQWAEGQRSYFCFANRAGGEPLTGPINGPGPAV